MTLTYTIDHKIES